MSVEDGGRLVSRPGTCVDCGKPTSYKAYKRCLSCARKGPLNPKWGKFTSADADAGRKRAGHRFELGPCVKCGKPSRDRHHINGNTLDNRPQNILTLCRPCHMAADGRLAKLVDRNKHPKKHA